MFITQQLTIESMLVKEDVELLSIKLKSDKDLDNEVKYAQQSCKGTSSTISATSANDSEKPKEDDLTGSEDYSESFVRLLKIPKTANGSCGFHLTRTKWDPYPWVKFTDNCNNNLFEVYMSISY